MGKIYKAIELRGKGALKRFQKPGLYKWWAPEEQFQKLLQLLLPNSKDDQETVEKKTEKTGNLYCIYVGQAKLLDGRLRKHLSGSLDNSTFRKSLAAILSARKKMDVEELKTKVNEFINKLKVECIDIENEDDLDIEESRLIAKKLRILNIDGFNHDDYYLYIDKPLTKLRKKI